MSIALERQGQLVAGVVYNPATDELFSAERGQGAFLNDRRMRVANRRALSDCVIACGVPHMGRGEHGPFMVELRHIMAQCVGIRRSGSAALDLAYVAAGRFDGCWEDYLSPWDMAGGIVLIREAGGFVTDKAGGDAMFERGGFVTGNETINQQLRDALARAAVKSGAA